MSRRHLPDELHHLESLTREELATRWTGSFGGEPPAGVRRELLIRAAAWDLQARRFGGLSPIARRLLKAAKNAARQRNAQQRDLRRHGDPASSECRVRPRTGRAGGMEAAPAPEEVLHPGSRIVRDWCGRPHVVDVVESGFVYEGRVYRSLSSIARLITGTNWSGPRFFGITRRRTSS
jgi:hypothetical protein